MRTKPFALFVLFLMIGVLQPVLAAPAADPVDIKVVVSAKKIWFVADEMPVKCICVKVKDANEKVVLEKCLSSKTADWSLDVETLPKGDYSIHLGKDKTVKFKR